MWWANKEHDEFKENHRFQMPPNAHRDDVRTVSQNVGMAIKALRA
ncbi:MAG: hypothetical protein P1P69_01460 [Methanosarcinaceae archaeon]|nr:hypothetical protein [Methanosarcinaceae archaeon]